MNHTVHNKLVSFIWSIADDCLRDVYVRGKYRDVILPMVVLRRLDTLLEPSKEKVLEEVTFQQNEMGLTELDDSGLKDASGYVFYNTSKWTLTQLYNTATNNQQILLANIEEYLNGYSANVKEIIDKFNLKAQVRHMANKDVLLDVLEKFISPYINLTPEDREDPDGNRLPALTNLGMGYVFEELIRKFNEENNEEAGEHFTPREVIELMTHLVFDPVKECLPPVMTIYDPACGSGGMLTESQNFIKDGAGAIRAKGDVYLYGKAILAWCEDNELDLNAKNRKKLLNIETWLKHQNQVAIAELLMAELGDDETSDYNQFKKQVDKALKEQKIKLSASDKNAILNAVSWYDEKAEKVIKKTVKFKQDKLDELLNHLDCSIDDLPDYGYYPTGSTGGQKNEFITYEPNSDLRDSESVPLSDKIHRYFLAEVKPHVEEAWINLNSTKIGYEISFNKYFYKHKPLRSMEEVASDIIALEQQAERLIADILGIDIKDVAGVDND